MELVPEYRDGAWRFDQWSMYLTDEQVKTYLRLENSDSYGESMHNAERQLIEEHKSEIISMWPDEITVIDLGCGQGKKTIIKVAAAQCAGKKVEFHAVDISDRMLSLTGANAKEAGVNVFLHNNLLENFEVIARDIRDGCIYFNLGANFSNFPIDFLDKLSNGMAENDFLYLSAQLHNEKNTQDILDAYAIHTFWEVVFGVLRRIGFEKDDFEYKPVLIGDMIEFSCVVKTPPEALSKRGMLPGDRIVVQTSRKPTLEGFKKILSKNFESKIWVNSDNTYAIAVCKKQPFSCHSLCSPGGKSLDKNVAGRV